MEQDYNDERRPRRRSQGSSSQGQRRRTRPNGSHDSRQHAHAQGSANPQRRRRTGAQRGSSQGHPSSRGSAHRSNGSTAQRQRPQGSRPPHSRGTGSSQRPTTGRVNRRTATDPRHPTRNNAHKAPTSSFMTPAKIGIAAGGVVVVGLLIWLLVGVFSRVTVTVNGEEVTLGGGSTVQTILDKELAKPQPGDLLDVDGKVLTTGGGEVCSATIDGQKADLNTPLTAGSEITIEDGEDLTEDAEVTEEVIEPKKDEGNRDFEAYWFGSIHLLSDGEAGLETTKTGKVSGKTITEVTKEPIDAGYRIYTAKPDDKVIALTFDDGPWPETTDQILDILEQYGAKATFFTIGSQIANTPDAVKRADALGCQVLTHSWDHAEGSGGGTSLAVMSSSEQIEEIEKGYKAIADVLGKEPAHILRAPGGNFYGDIIENVWKIVDAEIGWDVDTEDWSRPGADSIRDTILSAKSGQVVLMHDGGGDRSQTVEALRQAMPTLVEQGYKFITIDELLAYGMPSSKSDIPTTTGDSTSSTDTTSSTSSSSSTSTTGSSSSSANASDEGTASSSSSSMGSSSSSTGSSSTGSSSLSSDTSGTGSSTGSSSSSSDSSSGMGSNTAYTQ